MNMTLGAAARYGLGFNGLLGIAVALNLASSILIPLTISVLLATILFPAAKWLRHRLRLPWFFACLSTIFLLVILSAAVFAALTMSVTSLVYQLPQDEIAWGGQYDQTVNRLRNDMPFLSKDMLPLRSENPNGFQAIKQVFSIEYLTPHLIKLAGYGVEQLSQLVLILFVILFLLLEAELLAKKVRAVFGTTSDNQKRVAEALAEMAEAIRTYLVWRTIINLGLAIVLGLFYRYVVHLEHWYLWAVLTAVLSYVPYIGTIIAGVPPILDALVFNPHPAEAAITIIVCYTLLVTLEGYLVVPWVMGKTMDLNATTVMVACLFWSLLWGVSGLFLAMPLMAAIKAVMMHADGLRPWGELLSSVETTPAAPPEESLPPRGDDKTVVMDAPVLPPTPVR